MVKVTNKRKNVTKISNLALGMQKIINNFIQGRLIYLLLRGGGGGLTLIKTPKGKGRSRSSRLMFVCSSLVMCLAEDLGSYRLGT